MSVKGTRSIVRGTQTGVAIVLANIPVGMAHTVNIRVYEPVPMELNIPDIVIPVGGIRGCVRNKGVIASRYAGALLHNQRINHHLQIFPE